MNYPIPTELKILTGNPGKRPLNKDEPQPKKIIPDIPSHLDAKARKYWKKYGLILFDLGLLTEMDGPAFGEVCQMYSDISKLTKEIRKEGRTFFKTNLFIAVDGAGTEHQEMKSNPKVTQLDNLRKEFRYSWGQFGGNPSDRTRLGVKIRDKRPEMEGLIN